ncbi:MAG: hypothetical protein ACLTC4_16980 [Hungatella hathewayi]
MAWTVEKQIMYWLKMEDYELRSLACYTREVEQVTKPGFPKKRVTRKI